MSEAKKITYDDLEELLKDDNKVKVGGKWASSTSSCVTRCTYCRTYNDVWL
jgi:hypothetical protein